MERGLIGGYKSYAYDTVIAGHFQENETYFINRPNGRHDWLMTFTLDGEGYFKVPGKELISQFGDVTLLKPDIPHQYGTRRGHTWYFVWAHFSSNVIETSLLPNDNLIQQRIENESARQRIHHAFTRVISDSRERGEYWNELCCTAIREIIMLLAQKKRHIMDSRIEETLYLLSQRMREPIRIEELAQSVGLSASRLSHLFKTITGHSIVDTLNRMRVQQAALLFEHTERSATQVCFDVGFQNYNHFTNQFRKWYGINPSSYMKNNRLAAIELGNHSFASQFNTNE
ncbi:AraC family transcriptional regulator, arabinose operon regulatory protein [Paenibacillus sp. 1_12]|uniref:helix-turn-helix domain-containing protein n=1 Tax=Paenibacillus sp. 1_12 TaxID=1566278 RepID=UPI0008E7EB1F|nr:helix-turn-helix domain-containing protein [Paenibacillus sp. 1_12]SFL23084.1 AraC family transcriptional regulator, arabinose operon regulatory protein [Paenibacillus sp. 1_12]